MCSREIVPNPDKRDKYLNKSFHAKKPQKLIYKVLKLKKDKRNASLYIFKYLFYLKAQYSVAYINIFILLLPEKVKQLR